MKRRKAARRDRVVRFLLSRVERVKFQAAADKRGMSLSSFIRLACTESSDGEQPRRYFKPRDPKRDAAMHAELVATGIAEAEDDPALEHLS